MSSSYVKPGTVVFGFHFIFVFSLSLLLSLGGCQKQSANALSGSEKEVIAQQTSPVMENLGVAPPEKDASAQKTQTSPPPVAQPLVAAASGGAMRAAAPSPMAQAREVGGDVFFSRPYYEDVPREQYETLPESDIKLVASEPVSTFSIDVDTGAYANVRRFLNRGQLPPHGAVRVEELINYFPYQYALPTSVEGKLPPFGVTTEIAPSPWNENTKLVRIGIRASDTAVENLPPANLVFLVDVSGSMHSPERLPLVKSTLKLLVEQLRAQDKVSLVTYASGTQVVLEPTSGSQKAKIGAAIEQLQAGGSTAGASGIALAYQMAQQGFIDKGINRILLATDGDFNVGITNFEQLKQMVAEKRKSGVSLTTLGFGVDNYNERLMEQLADAGDGNYSYIDTLREARKVLVEQLSSTLSVVARDVKLQVEFNPEKVAQYRLVGYENRALKREDFANDKVDAGEIGSGHTVTALYEIVLKGEKGWVEPLRYQQAPAAKSELSEELAILRIRYKAPGEEPSKLMEFPLKASQIKPSLQEASEDFRFVAAVAAYGQILKGGKYTGAFSLDNVAQLAHGAKGEDRLGLRAEFVQLVDLAKSLQTKASQQK
ncbi:MAG: VWA domain-containing protein [Cystobacterineae bacterium]|nr:VWA domain-containing protein [Cystobacterineae bacterium]